MSYITRVNGKIGEYRLASELLMRGHDVLIPSVDIGTDIVIGNGKNIQMKASRNGTFFFHSAKSSKARIKDGSDFEPHSMEGVDIVVCWSMDCDEWAIIPSEYIRGLVSLSLNDSNETNKWRKYIGAWDLLGKSNHSKVAGSSLGKSGEFRVISELMIRHYDITCPVIDDGVDVYIRSSQGIQVKTSMPFKVEYRPEYKHTAFIFNLKKSLSSRDYHNGHKEVHAHSLEHVDYLIFWAVGDGFYIIPADKVRGKTSISFTADHDKRTQGKWNQWLPYKDNWSVLDGILPEIMPLLEKTCPVCQYTWQPFKDGLTRCPSCGARLQRPLTGVAKVHCNQCEHEWTPNHRSGLSPKVCPKCHSTFWNQPKRDPIPVLDDAVIKQMYLDGHSMNDIAGKFKVTFTTMRARIETMGIIRPRGESISLSKGIHKAERLALQSA